MTPSWYWRRLKRMSLSEVANRASSYLRQRRWRRPDRRPDGLASLIDGSTRIARVALPMSLDSEDDRVKAALVASSDQVLAGELMVFGRRIARIGADPDWFTDPTTGRSTDRNAYCFDVPYRDESLVGDIKFIWEPSRHLAAMQLASAWRQTGRDAYASRAGALLAAWWRDNPFLHGVHWTSAIEVGLRLLSWTWIRALLDQWDGCRMLFDENPVFLRQLYHHQAYIRAFHSEGSSANNHLLAEMAGLATAAVAFPWFAESAEWAADGRAQLVEQAMLQTFSDGFNREQAMDYHLFVFEILLSAGLMAQLAGQPLGRDFDDVLCHMSDALAASLDATGRPPRFGDGDEGRALMLDGDETPQVGALLGASAALFGAARWWPEAARTDTVLARIAAFVTAEQPGVRDQSRPSLMMGAGLGFLRCGEGPGEIWLRCDHGCLGYLSIAAHGHADALSVELRVGGVDVLADPGTYCYHGKRDWRRYFKSTLGHNTLTVDGRDQAENDGPFLWTTDVPARLEAWDVKEGAGLLSWQACHHGYRRLADPVTHHRRVDLNVVARSVEIVDWIDARIAHRATLCYHFGPAISVTLTGDCAALSWPLPDGFGAATMQLPRSLEWSLVRGAISPPRGWYSSGFARKEPAFALMGSGNITSDSRLTTALHMAHSMPRSVGQAEEARCATPAAF